MAFWVPIGSLFIFRGPYFQCFGFIPAKNVNSVCNADSACIQQWPKYLEMAPGEGHKGPLSKVSNHLPQCIRKVIVHFKFKCGPLFSLFEHLEIRNYAFSMKIMTKCLRKVQKWSQKSLDFVSKA